MGGASVLHHQAVLVEVPVHVGHVLRRHQLRHLQSDAQAAVLQDAEVRMSSNLLILLLLSHFYPILIFIKSLEMYSVTIKTPKKDYIFIHPFSEALNVVTCFQYEYLSGNVVYFFVLFL